MSKSLKLCSPSNLCFAQLAALGEKTHTLMVKGIHQLEAASHHPASAEQGHAGNIPAALPPLHCSPTVLCLRENQGIC